MITYDNSASDFHNSTGTYSFSYTNNGDYLFAITSNEVSSVTYGGQNLSQLYSFNPTNPPFGANCPPLILWGKSVPLTGINNIQYVSSGGSGTAICVASYLGTMADQSASSVFSNYSYTGQVATWTTGTTTGTNSWGLGLFISTGSGINHIISGIGTLRTSVNSNLFVNNYGFFDTNGTTGGTFSLRADLSSGSEFFRAIAFELQVSGGVSSFVPQMIII